MTIAAGSDHTLGIESGGSLRAWGGNSRGQLGGGNGTTSPIRITVGVPEPAAAVPPAPVRALPPD